MARVHGFWFLLPVLFLASLAALVGFSPPVPWVLLALLLVLVLLRTLRWSATVRRLPRRLFGPRRPRAGVTLLSALVSLTLLALASAMAVQTLKGLLTLRRAQVSQTQALAAAVSMLEQARIGATSAAGLSAMKPYQASLAVSPGPVAGTVSATARVQLPAGGRVELATFLPETSRWPRSAPGRDARQGGGER